MKGMIIVIFITRLWNATSHCQNFLKGLDLLVSFMTQVFENIGLEHSGEYTCLASNIAGSAEKTFSVAVLGQYRFIIFVTSQC